MREQVQRIAARYLLSKGGVSLLPEFNAALQEFQKWNPEPMRKFGDRVMSAIFPGGVKGEPASWYAALGAPKKTALNNLYRGIQYFEHNIQTYYPSPASHIPKDTGQFERQIRLFTGWLKWIRTLEIASEAGDETRLIKRGGFNINPMPGVSKVETEAALEALDAAAEKVGAKFPNLLYGDVFFTTHLAAKVAAQYYFQGDKILLSVRARKRFDDVYSLIHEMGHRFDMKDIIRKDLKKQIYDLSTRKVFEMTYFDEQLRTQVAEEALRIAQGQKAKKPFTGMSKELELWVKDAIYGVGPYIRSLNKMYISGEIDDSKYITEVRGTKDVNVPGALIHGPLYVTPYGATKPIENFAEAFAHYVLGMKMPEEFVAIFDQA